MSRGRSGVPTTLRERIAVLLKSGAIPRIWPRNSLDYGMGDVALVRQALRDADEEGLRALAATARRETVRATALAAIGDAEGLIALHRTARRRATHRILLRALPVIDRGGKARLLNAAVKTILRRLEGNQ